MTEEKNNRQTHTLANGLRVVLEQSDSNVAYIGVLTDAGSRDDCTLPGGRHGAEGLAHFVEHTIFKGTRHRKSWQISNRMENIGGELNAYTTKEWTMLFTNLPAGYEDRAIELLSDLIGNPTFPHDETERERGVIEEEIYSYRDNPVDSLYDEFDELFYKDSALAHNILGTPESIQGITGTEARAFVEARYTPGRMIAYCVTPADPQKMLKLFEKHFGNLNRTDLPDGRTAPSACAPFDKVWDRERHQANTLMAVRLPDFTDRERPALLLTTNILGGPAMNSRLNRELREKRGLVYSVDCMMAGYSDSKSVQIYFGSDSRAVDRCIKLVKQQTELLASSVLSPRTFTQAREQLCGQLLVAGDNRESQAMNLAKSMMIRNSILDNRDVAELVRNVSAEEVRGMAEKIAQQPMSRLTII